MADLPTNYLDDILAQSMNGKRKFRITRPDGTFEEVIIEDISEYSQTGSTFGAGDINRTNQAVNEKFDSEDVVDPMLTTEPGFAADAYKTKLQFDEQNKNLGNRKIQCGYSTANHVDFAEPFTGKEYPFVFCTVCSSSDIHAFSVTVYNQTHTGFDVKKKYVNANEIGNADEVFFWLAIG